MHLHNAAVLGAKVTHTVYQVNPHWFVSLGGTAKTCRQQVTEEHETSQNSAGALCSVANSGLTVKATSARERKWTGRHLTKDKLNTPQSSLLMTVTLGTQCDLAV